MLQPITDPGRLPGVRSTTSSRRLRRVVGAIVLLLVTGACKSVPEKVDVPITTALPQAGSGAIYDMAAAAVQRTGSPDALALVPDARSGMEWRLAMIDSATTSLDIQYFIWSGDKAGSLLLDRVLAAADRGVQVRLLIDDMYLLADAPIAGQDEALAAIDAHPNVSFKIFNIGRFRSGRLGIAGNIVGGFKEFNRRMHNKMMIADGRLGMVGGRNMADEYYGVRSDYNFIDLDAVVVGDVLPSMISAFDIYWNASQTYQAIGLNPDATGNELEALRTELTEYLAEHAETLAAFPLAPADWSDFLAAAASRMVAAEATFLQDNPEVEGDETYRLYDMLREFDTPEDHDVIMVSPYLIPLQEGIDELQQMADDGIEVTLLTASLGSVDLEATVSHYKKYRTRILETGAKLYEFHHQPGETLRSQADTEPVRAEFIAFHPKLAVTDRRVCYVGSLNLDPRALVINTENGLVIESEAFCSEVADLAELYIQPENSWEVTLDEKGNLQWTSYEGTVTQQPARSTGQRMADFFYRILPIENIL